MSLRNTHTQTYIYIFIFEINKKSKHSLFRNHFLQKNGVEHFLEFKK